MDGAIKQEADPNNQEGTLAMNDQKISTAYMSDKSEHEIVLDDENNCCLCGSTLALKHQVDYLTLTIKEDAHCPSCKIQMKSKQHSLQ